MNSFFAARLLFYISRRSCYNSGEKQGAPNRGVLFPVPEVFYV